MYHEDWLIRQLQSFILAIARVIFKKDDVAYKIKNENEQSRTDMLYTRLSGLLEQRKINEAEDLLFAGIDPGNLNDLWLAMDFYKKVNELDDDALAECNFSREEILEGFEEIRRIFHIIL